MEVLYIGSGNSATKAPQFREGRLVCGVNNAWRLLEYQDFWIHSGDFPSESRPPNPKKFQEITYPQYSKTAKSVCDRLNVKTTSPEHHVGYTIFFQGLFWIAEHLKPSRILLLGFDHDYNPEKLDKWKKAGNPAPHNNYQNKDRKTTIAQWSDSFFAGMQPDFFYGHGTPDPVRLGEEHLKTLFARAKDDLLPRLGVECFNASGVTTGLNPFPQYDGQPTS